MSDFADDSSLTSDTSATHEDQHRAGYAVLIVASLIAVPAALAIFGLRQNEFVYFVFATIFLASIFGFSWGTARFVRSYGQRFWTMPGTWLIAAGYIACSLWSLFSHVSQTTPTAGTQGIGVLAAIALVFVLAALCSNTSRVGFPAGVFLTVVQIVAGPFIVIGIFWVLNLFTRQREEY